MLDSPPTKLPLNEDGTPKRKYELDEAAESKVGVRAAIALIMVNALVLIKNLLPWDKAEAGAAKKQAQEEKAAAPAGEPSSVAMVPSQPSTEEQGPEESVKDEPGPAGSSLRLFPRGGVFEPDEEPASLYSPTGSGMAAGNDNEALYGAMPGSPIDLSAPASGAPGSSASGTGPSASGDGDVDDGDESEPGGDDDDDATRTNRLPSLAGPVILADLVANRSLTLQMSDLLHGASDPDGDPLYVNFLRASSGTLVRRDTTTWIFTPETDDVSGVSFAYRISDGEGWVAQTAMLNLVQPELEIIVGTEGADTLVGTPRADRIFGLGGDDTIIGRESDDVIDAGEGNDRVVAGDGNDVIYAGDGNDVVYAGKGNDAVFGGSGNDVLFGEEGDDTLVGEEGDDTVSGGEGNDLIYGGSGNDELHGDDGNDVIDGGTGDDAIYGGRGNDTIIGAAGNDTVDGGEGDDRIIAQAGDGDDVYGGGSGNDTYDASGLGTQVVIDLEGGTASGEEIGSDTIYGFENAYGGSGADIFYADDNVNIFAGGEGNDLFVFGSAKSIGLGRGGRDKILDFEVGDRIDLDDISEEFAQAVGQSFNDTDLQKFRFISQDMDFSKPGQMKFKYDEIDGVKVTILQGNIDFDAAHDFELEIIGTYDFKDDDFHWRA
jgi:Ca2+-binding RTX toxin-like protein